jgi:hypothetical protein
MRRLEGRRRVRVVASFAEYLAEDVHADRPGTRSNGVAGREWCDGDCELSGERADVLRPQAELFSFTVPIRRNTR